MEQVAPAAPSAGLHDHRDSRLVASPSCGAQRCGKINKQVHTATCGSRGSRAASRHLQLKGPEKMLRPYTSYLYGVVKKTWKFFFIQVGPVCATQNIFSLCDCNIFKLGYTEAFAGHIYKWCRRLNESQTGAIFREGSDCLSVFRVFPGSTTNTNPKPKHNNPITCSTKTRW